MGPLSRALCGRVGALWRCLRSVACRRIVAVSARATGVEIESQLFRCMKAGTGLHSRAAEPATGDWRAWDLVIVLLFLQRKHEIEAICKGIYVFRI